MEGGQVLGGVATGPPSRREEAGEGDQEEDQPHRRGGSRGLRSRQAKRRGNPAAEGEEQDILL